MKRVKLFLILAAIVLALSSCTTMIVMDTLVPAEVDVSGYKTIAVTSTTDDTKWTYPLYWNSNIPFKSVNAAYYQYLSILSNLDFNASSKITDVATQTIYNAIDNGYFKVVSPTVSDAFVTTGKYSGDLRGTLMNNGIDAILTTEISSLYYDEYIMQEVSDYQIKDANNVLYNETKFYIVQKYALAINYILIDVENNRVIDTDTVGSDIKTCKTLIGHTKNASGQFERYYNVPPKASALFSSIITEFSSTFKNRLTPHTVSRSFEFLPNEPKTEALESAYEALKDRYWGIALRLFYDEYLSSGHIHAGGAGL